MTLKTGVQVKDRNVEMLFDQGQFWENVDWSKTRAYAMGLGEMYVNLKGRESQGIRSDEHTSELQSQSNLVCRLLLEKKKPNNDALLGHRRSGLFGLPHIL